MSIVPNATSSGWFSSTIIAAATLAAFQVGTGGLPTAQYYKSRGDKGYAFARYDASAFDDAPVLEPTPAEDLSRIRDMFKFSVTELASLFGVSRQAIYDWQSGKAIGIENRTRLQDLARASDVVRAANIQNGSYLLRRKIADGKTFIDLIREGGSAEKSALDLVAMLGRESDQRARLDARLGARKDRRVQSTSIGAPMLNEEG